jgi:hypothetical protein
MFHEEVVPGKMMAGVSAENVALVTVADKVEELCLDTVRELLQEC